MDSYTNKKKKKRRKKKLNIPKDRTTNSTSTKRFSSHNGIIGKIQNFWYDHGEFIGGILKILGSIISILLLLGVYFGWFDTTDEDLNSKEKQLSVKYSIVSSQETPSVEVKNNTGVTLTLLFDDPTVTYNDISDTLSYLYEDYKEKLDEKGEKLVVMEAKIYNRKILLDKGYLPKGYYYYGLKAGFTKTLNTKRPKIDEYKTKLDYIAVKKPYMQQETDPLTGEVIDEYEVNSVLKGAKYEKLLLLIEYATLFDGNYEKAAKFYVGYDLRIDIATPEGADKIKDITNFINSYLSNGEQSSIVDNKQQFWLQYKKTNNKKYRILRKYALTDDLNAALYDYK